MTLCEECQKVVLTDGDDKFQVEYEDGRPHHVVTAPNTTIGTDFLLYDEFPNLEGLLESSRQGCEFCEFLWKTLKSDQLAYALEKKLDGHDHETQASRIKINIVFKWNCSAELSEVTEKNKNCLVVLLYFEELHVSLKIYCGIQADRGTQSEARKGSVYEANSRVS